MAYFTDRPKTIGEWVSHGNIKWKCTWGLVQFFFLKINCVRYLISCNLCTFIFYNLVNTVLCFYFYVIVRVSLDIWSFKINFCSGWLARKCFKSSFFPLFQRHIFFELMNAALHCCCLVLEHRDHSFVICEWWLEKILLLLWH